MLTNDKIQLRTSIFPTLLVILVLLFVVILIHNNAFAQTLHNRTLYEIVKQSSELNGKAQIDVGIEPIAIGIHELTNKVYVANRGSDSISVIAGDSNTKIKDIPVGNRPVVIGINPLRDKVYVSNFNSANISVISTATDTKIKDISVGDNPSDIAIDEYKNRVYVLNQGSDSISIIENDTKIGKDIPLENEPYAIGIVRNNSFKNTLYVTHAFSNNVSIISGENYTKISNDISVGDFPAAIDVDEFANRDLIYVANSGSDDITIIDGTNNTKINDFSVGDNPMDVKVVRPDLFTSKILIANAGSNNISVIDENGLVEYIPVGKSPVAIGFNQRTNTIYVANLFSNGISVIDGVNNALVARILVSVSPFNAGYIECDGLKTPINQYLYVESGAECKAKSNKGFEFQSWEEKLNVNSTLLIKGAFGMSNTIFDSIVFSLDSIVNFLGITSSSNSIKDYFNINSDEPEANLKITKFGTFTANFKELPPPIPGEYMATLLGVVATAFVGSWLTPSLIEWRKTKRHQHKLNDYQNELKDLYKDNKFDKNDISNLDRLRDNVISGYTRGAITKEQYDVLLNNISTRYNEIFQNEINVLKNTNNNAEIIKLLEEIQSDLNDAYLKKKIDKEHYDLLKGMISELNNKN